MIEQTNRKTEITTLYRYIRFLFLQLCDSKHLNISKFSFFKSIKKTHFTISRLKTTICCCLGNGPSGISLSYMLSGNWPYYTGESEDELLHTRLQQEPDLSLVEQDLAFLSDVSFYKIRVVLKLQNSIFH